MFDYTMLPPYSPASDSNHSMSDQCVSANKLAAPAAEPSPNQLLCSSQEAEQSFIYNTASDGSILPIKMSQDYGDENSIFDEINQISLLGCYYPPGTPCKVIQEALTVTPSSTNFCEFVGNNIDLDSKLETISQFGDVMLSVFPVDQTVIYSHSDNADDDIKFYVLTPAASPQSPGAQPLEDTIDYSEIIIPQSQPDQEYYVQSEHNYNTQQANKTQGQRQHTTSRNRCKRKLQLDRNQDEQTKQIKLERESVGYSKKHIYQTVDDTDEETMRHPRVPPLKLKLHPAVMRQHIEPFALNTPEISNNNTLDLETDTMEFDLINFINSSQVRWVCVDILIMGFILF